MKVTSETAGRIAEAGAAKMTGRYTFRTLGMSRAAGDVTKVEDGTRYKVNTFTGTCSCPFRRDNATCKHIVFAKAELEWEARHIAGYESRF